MDRMDRAANPPGADVALNARFQDTDLSFAVEAAQRGNEAAFRLVFRAVQPRLLRYLSGIVGDDAEDVASESWLQIARDLKSFHGDFDSFRGWTATVARHRALDHLRGKRRTQRRLVRRRGWRATRAVRRGEWRFGHFTHGG
jgi:DNA-directed RNA polymerase specialized sigma24 family protein